jgi:capsular polysaccharide biosynthesis protein
MLELKELTGIFINYKRNFWLTVIVCLALGMIVFSLQPTKFETNLMLNVTRKGIQQTEEYRFDDFYRLQADERFADTAVRWLGAPQIMADVINEAGTGVKDFDGKFIAKRLSSQMIEVSYATKDSATAQKIAVATEKVLENQIKELDKDQKEETWFKLIFSQPITNAKKIPLVTVIFASLAIGIFLGFWSVLFKHYFSK